MFKLDSSMDVKTVFTPGVHENVKISKISYEAVGKNSPYMGLMIFFESDKHEARITFFEPKSKNAAFALGSKLRQIMLTFMSEKEATIQEVTNFADFAKKVIQLTLGKFEDKSFNVMFEKSGNFVELPSYHKQFIELHVPGVKPSMKYSEEDAKPAPKDNIKQVSTEDTIAQMYPDPEPESAIPGEIPDADGFANIF